MRSDRRLEPASGTNWTAWLPLDVPSRFPKLDVAHRSSPVLRNMHLCSGCEHNRSVLGHDDGVFELGDETAVDCAQRPAVLSLYNFIRRRR
jgi:hypothetical protein